MFAVMGEHDMVGQPVGRHHLVDEFRRVSPPAAHATSVRGDEPGPHVDVVPPVVSSSL
jgi:hypothetical protein